MVCVYVCVQDDPVLKGIADKHKRTPAAVRSWCFVICLI